MIAAMATLLTACSDDENKMDGPVEARVTASMGVETRVVNDDKGEFTWEENDPIGVMVIKVEQPEGGGTTSNMVSRYKNVKYLAQSVGESTIFKVEEGAGIFFQDATETVTFAAYYPYQNEDAGSLPGTVTVNTKDNNGTNTQKNIDFLFATGATASKSSSTVQFADNTSKDSKFGGVDSRFKHQMAQLKLIVQASTSDGFIVEEAKAVCDEESKYVLTSGLIHEGTFTISVSEEGEATGIAEAGKTTSNSDWDITKCVYQNSDDQMSRTYTLILLPQESSSFYFKATIGGQVYISEDFNPTLSAGKTCSYTIIVKKTGLDIEGCKIAEWEKSSIAEEDIYVEIQ